MTCNTYRYLHIQQLLLLIRALARFMCTERPSGLEVIIFMYTERPSSVQVIIFMYTERPSGVQVIIFMYTYRPSGVQVIIFMCTERPSGVQVIIFMCTERPSGVQVIIFMTQACRTGLGSLESNASIVQPSVLRMCQNGEATDSLFDCRPKMFTDRL